VQVAAQQGARFVYTPQIVRNGKDWRDYTDKAPGSGRTRVGPVALQRTAHSSDTYEASVTPSPGVTRWSAFWTVTEHGHASKVKAGENDRLIPAT
jgi:hypothetical protein